MKSSASAILIACASKHSILPALTGAGIMQSNSFNAPCRVWEVGVL